LFYGEGFMPVEDIMEAIIHGLGYHGWISMELFNRSMSDPSPSVPEEHAKRGIASWHIMVKDFDLQEGSPKRVDSAISPISSPQVMSAL